MNNVVVVMKEGGLRRKLRKIAIQQGYRVETINPSDFLTHLLEIVEPPKNVNVQYEYVVNKYDELLRRKQANSNVFLFISDVDSATEELLKDELGAFFETELPSDKSAREIFNILSGYVLEKR